MSENEYLMRNTNNSRKYHNIARSPSPHTNSRQTELRSGEDMTPVKPKPTRMHPLQLVMVLMCTFTIKTAAEANCDPQTQYVSGGECCTMCAPGTSMSNNDCQAPLCINCEEDEYQETHTIESKCKRQGYCDPNKNFERPVHDRTKKTTCMCMQGFHCSSPQCETCVPHKSCEPGFEAKFIGNHTHDTVCQKCPEGRYSDELSGNSTCKKWTECVGEYHIKQRGTDKSDNICEKTSRTHLYVIGVIVALIVVLVVIAVVVKLYKGKQTNPADKVKACFEACLGETPEPVKENTLLTTPTHPAEEESLSIERSMQYPEENDDDRCLEISDIGFTDNGNVVKQENGKAEALSRQESQTQTFTD